MKKLFLQYVYILFSLPSIATHLEADEVFHTAECSRAVYESARDMNANLAGKRYVFGRPNEHRLYRAISSELYSSGEIYTNPKTSKTVAAFRGTVSLEEWIRDADTRMAPLKINNEVIGHVHRGFLTHVEDLYEDFTSKLKSSGYKYGDPIIFSGHSLGAASALLAAVKFLHDSKFMTPRELSVVLFSSPRVGDEMFVNSLRNIIPSYNILHFYCTGDVVPGLPINRKISPYVGQMDKLNPLLHYIPLIGERAKAFLNTDYDDAHVTLIPVNAFEASIEKLNFTKAFLWGAGPFILKNIVNSFGYSLPDFFESVTNAQSIYQVTTNLIPVVAITNHACHPELILEVYEYFLRRGLYITNEEYINQSTFFSSERNFIFRYFTS